MSWQRLPFVAFDFSNVIFRTSITQEIFTHTVSCLSCISFNLSRSLLILTVSSRVQFSLGHISEVRFSTMLLCWCVKLKYTVRHNVKLNVMGQHWYLVKNNLPPDRTENLVKWTQTSLASTWIRNKWSAILHKKSLWNWLSNLNNDQNKLD